MEKIKLTKENLMKIKDIVIFVLLLLWMIMPIFETIRPINDNIIANNRYFELMKTIGIIGIGTAVYIIYDKIKNSEDKKQVLKEIAPIFIFVLYMIWTLISCFQAKRENQAFNGNNYRKEGYYMYLNYAGYFLCAFLLESKKLRKILLNAFVITSTFLVSISRITLNGTIYTDIFTKNSIDHSVFRQFNHYAYYLTMSLMCCLGLFLTEKNKILKVVYLAIFTLIAYGLIYNHTFGCYLAVAVVLILYGIYALVKKRDRSEILIAIAIFVLLSCVITKNNTHVVYTNVSGFISDIKTVMTKIVGSNTESLESEESESNEANNEENEKISDKEFEKAGTNRVGLWKYGIKIISKKPIIGYGPDNLKDEYLKEGLNEDRPHNLLIYLAAVSGIPGMLLYVTAVGIIVIKGIKSLIRKDGDEKIFLLVIITYSISSMFGNSMYYTSPYFFIFLGSLMQYNLNKQ